MNKIVIKYNNEHKNLLLYEELGRGAQSKVYRGKFENEKIIMAVKIYHKSIIENDELHKSLFKSEYKNHKNLSHENIVKFYGYGHDKYNYYFLFEYCNGGTLKNKKLNLTKSREYFIQILKALKYLKREKILHLDIKPDNILIKNDKIKLADFGFSVKLKDEHTKVFQRGTPNYMAPEMILGKKINHKTDLWSAGVVFYYMLYKKTPFYYKIDEKGERIYDDINEENVFFNIINNEIVPPSKKNLYNNVLKHIFIKNIDKRIDLEELMRIPSLH